MGYKRKYRKGAKITSLDELAKQEFIYFYDKITHAGWFMSWQFSLARRYIERGCLYYAEKIEMESLVIEEITRSDYNALEVKQPHTLYIFKD